MSRQHHRGYERFLWIDAEIRRGAYPSARQIADHFEISQKTAQRDIDFMRDRFGAPLEYSAEQRGWFYSEPFVRLPALILTEGDIVAILMAERLAREFAGSPLGEPIELALAKVAGALTDTVSVDITALAAAWSINSLPTMAVDSKQFHELTRAINEQRAVSMTYFTAASGKVSTRRIEPIHLRNHQGDWYLIAFDHSHDEYRIFLVGRIRALDVIDEPCEIRPDFDLAKFLEGSFQMFVGTEPIDVVLEFDEYQARWIRERRLPHESARIDELGDGRLQLSMCVLSLDAVQRYVLQYGSHVTVIAPDRLRDRIRTEAESIAAKYGPNDA